MPTPTTVTIKHGLATCLLWPFIPVLAIWVRHHQRRILREGCALSTNEHAIAKSIGIVHPENVRILVVDSIPLPFQRLSAWLSRYYSGIVSGAIGLTLGHGIYLQREKGESVAIVAHELVHVKQYERLGGITPFLRRYIRECLVDGYDLSALEKEATAEEMKWS